MTPQTTQHLVANLEDGASLGMFDTAYDSPSDPGAFVGITRWQGNFYLKFSNHGWSSSWYPVTREELEDYLWVCRHDNMVDSKRSYTGGNMGYSVSANPSPLTKIISDPNFGHAAYVRRRISMNGRPHSP